MKLMTAWIADSALFLASEAGAQDITLEAGVASGNPEVQDYERERHGKTQVNRITADKHAPTVAFSVGANVPVNEAFSLRGEAQIGANAFATDKAGCINCPGGNPGPNGMGPGGPADEEFQRNAEGRKGYHWGAFGAVNALGNVALTDRVTLSAGGGIGAAYHKSDTCPAYDSGHSERGSDTSLLLQGLARVSHRVGENTTVRLGYAR